MICVRCGRTEQLEEHHIVELCNGGVDEPENKELRCCPCHKLEHVMRLIRASLYRDRQVSRAQRCYNQEDLGRKREHNKARLEVYERRLKALADLNTPALIRERGTYLSYWGDSSLHSLPRRERTPVEEAVDNQINMLLERAMEVGENETMP